MSDFIPNFSLNLNKKREDDPFLYDLIEDIEREARMRMELLEAEEAYPNDNFNVSVPGPNVGLPRPMPSSSEF